MIRDILLKLALKSYSFAPIKDKAAFKAQLAETLRKEAYSKAFSTLEGTVAVKENNANLMISEQIIVEQIYELAADLLKTKVDETHRVIATITSVLTTRLSEAKLTQVEVQ
jgi:predicted transcriptional regulator